jgi:galactose mutarotase-like enzyme
MAWFSIKNHPYFRLAEQSKRDAQQREREKDMQEIWPLCLTATDGNVEKARDVFENTVRSKPAWLALGEYWRRLYINDLTPDGYKKGSGTG